MRPTSPPARPHFRRERALMRAGVWPVAGVDEAGRGPLAGPVAAAAVILDPEKLPRGLADSKVLTAAEREELYDIILSRALAVAVGFSPAGEIDRINIRQATLTAMCRALHALPVRASHALVDGNDFPQRFHCPGETIATSPGSDPETERGHTRAVHSISTAKPRGSAPAWIVVRAGYGAVNCLA